MAGNRCFWFSFGLAKKDNSFLLISVLYRRFVFLEISRLKPGFGTQYPFVIVWVGREYEMDIVDVRI